MEHEFDGYKYRRASRHQEEWGTRLINELALKGNERVLDLGCGDGRLTDRIAELVPGGFVVGIDSSSGMIEAAMTHSRPNLRFQKRDIEDLGEVEQYDVIYSNATLHWIHDHQSLLTAVHRALRVDGIARFNFGAEGNCPALNTVMEEVMSLPEYRDYFSAFANPWYMPNVDAYADLAGTIPFRKVDVWGEIADCHFPDSDAMIRWIDQPCLVLFMAPLPQEVRASFRTAVVERMVSRCRETDGRYFERFLRVNLRALK